MKALKKYSLTTALLATSILSNTPTSAADFNEKIKNIKIGDNTTLDFSGSARARLESHNNLGFAQANDDQFLLTRFLLNAKITHNDNLTFFIQGKGAYATERDLPGGSRSLDVDELALQQAYVDIKLKQGKTTYTIRPGRQALNFGNQRLVSPLPWANTLRAWDGISIIAETGDYKITAFATQHVPVQKYSFNDADDNDQFYGVYANATLNDKTKYDLYFLGRDRDGSSQTYNGTTGTERRYTLGARIFGDFNQHNDYDIEAAYQTGSVGTGDIAAYMIAAKLGHKINKTTKAYIGFDYASGDKQTGGDVETFSHLYPLGHAFYGAMDAIGRQNAIDISTGISTKASEKLKLKADLHFFHKAQSADSVYNAGGGALATTASSSDKYIGTEIDLTAIYNINENTTATLGYSHFFTGDFIDNAKPTANEDADFIFLQVQYKF